MRKYMFKPTSSLGPYSHFVQTVVQFALQLVNSLGRGRVLLWRRDSE